MIGDAYLMLYPSRVFFLSELVYTRNEPQPSRENVRRSRIDRYKDWKARSLDVLPILSSSNCQKLCIHLPLSLRSSKYWPTLDRRGQMNSTAIPWRIFFYRIPLARRMKNRTPRGWMIPQHRNYRNTAWRKPQYHNTVNPHFPLGEFNLGTWLVNQVTRRKSCDLYLYNLLFGFLRCETCQSSKNFTFQHTCCLCIGHISNTASSGIENSTDQRRTQSTF